MRSSAKTLWVVVLAVVLVGWYLLAVRSGSPMVVGVILPLSGPAQSVGEQVRDGMRLAVDELNDRGGVQGSPIELVVEDSGSGPEGAAAAFKRIEESHQPLFYVSATSAVSTAISPLAEEAEVVLVPVVTTATAVTEDKKWTFRYFPVTEVEIAPALALLEDLDVASLGILHVGDEFGKSVAAGLTEAFGATGGVVRTASFPPSQTAFEAEIGRVAASEAVYLIGFPPQMVKLYAQLRAVEYPGTIISSTSGALPSIMGLPTVDGSYLVAPILYDPNFLFATELRARYQERYDKPLDYFGANGYDAVQMVASLLERQIVSRASLQQVLEGGFVYPGVLGSIQVEPGQHDISFPLFATEVRDGTLVYQYDQ